MANQQHPTLPLRIDSSKASDSDGNIGMTPGDLSLMQKIATEKGFKNHVDHRESLKMSNTHSFWCNELQEKFSECQKKFPTAQCDRNRQLFTSDCGAIMVKKTAEEDKKYSEIKLGIEAKLRGMNSAEFLEYERQEMEYCKKMCSTKPLPPGMNKYCGK